MSNVVFTDFEDKTHDEIQSILINNYRKWLDKADENAQKVATDSRSTSLKNKSREITAGINAITELLEDLGIDVDELDC